MPLTLILFLTGVLSAVLALIGLTQKIRMLAGIAAFLFGLVILIAVALRIASVGM